MATNPQQMQAQADTARLQQASAQQAQAASDMARSQQGPAQPYMPSSAPGGSAGRGASNMAMKKGGKVKKMSSGGSASSRADGIATKGKTRGKMC